MVRPRAPRNAARKLVGDRFGLLLRLILKCKQLAILPKPCGSSKVVVRHPRRLTTRPPANNSFAVWILSPVLDVEVPTKCVGVLVVHRTTRLGDVPPRVLLYKPPVDTTTFPTS